MAATIAVMASTGMLRFGGGDTDGPQGPWDILLFLLTILLLAALVAGVAVAL